MRSLGVSRSSRTRCDGEFCLNLKLSIMPYLGSFEGNEGSLEEI